MCLLLRQGKKVIFSKFLNNNTNTSFRPLDIVLTWKSDCASGVGSAINNQSSYPCRCVITAGKATRLILDFQANSALHFRVVCKSLENRRLRELALLECNILNQKARHRAEFVGQSAKFSLIYRKDCNDKIIPKIYQYYNKSCTQILKTASNGQNKLLVGHCLRRDCSPILNI